MDFSKIRPAVEEIALTDEQKQDIVAFCKGKKRKKFSYKSVGFAAAVIVVVIALASPGFIMKASAPLEADRAENAAFGVYDGILSDEKIEEDIYANSTSQAAACEKLFEAEGFAEIYSVIPEEFLSLVPSSEYEEWKKTVTVENGMALQQFVMHFGITRDEFDAANAIYEQRADEFSRLDAEIIYSFDKELTDHFYLLTWN